MRILVVNDDGIDAAGLHALAEKFAPGNEIYMVAPESERSGFSHSVTIFRDIRYYKTAHGIESYALSGTPADCVKFGVLHLFRDKRPDVVLSGINSGPNLGSDIMYSGTVAAASEAVFLNVPAIAVSLGDWTTEKKSYEAAAEFMKRNFAALYGVAEKHAGEILLSVNYPCGVPYKGAVFTKAGVNWYDDYFDETENTGIVQLKGKPVPHNSDEGDCDVSRIKNGYATVTPVRLDRNHYEILESCKDKVKLV